MKRFSSAQCLSNELLIRQQLEAESSCCANEQPTTRAVSREPAGGGMSSKVREESGHQQQQQKRPEKRSAKQQAKHERRNQENGGPASGAPGFLSPDDPMILARQRRPSVSNQGSLNVDQQALFSAVECNQLERARAILEEGKAKVNSLNGDKLTCLDIAVLLRNVQMVRLLQQYNAKEGSAYLNREGRANQLYALYTEARRLVEDLSRSLNAISPNAAASSLTTASTSGSGQASHAPTALAGPQSDYGFLSGQMNSSGQLMLATGSLLSSALLEEKQRQLQYWRRRLDLFTHMRYEFERLQIPSAPELIVLQVTGENSLGVKIVHSLRSNSIALNQRSGFDSSSAMLNQDCEGLDSDEPQAREATDSFGGLQARSLNSINQSDLESLPACVQGRKCTHWQLLATSNLNLSVVGLNPTQKQLERSPANPAGASGQAAGGQSEGREEKLAVFNQLLEQQLNLLRNQQRSHQLNKLQVDKSSRLQGPSQAGSSALKRPSILMMLSQNTSTDSACETLTSSSLAGKGKAVAKPEAAFPESSRAELEPCQSITYKLMTSQPPPPLPGMACAQLINSAASSGACGAVSGSAADNLLKLAVSCGAGGGGGGASGEREKVIITKYKIEWSLNEQMDPVLNSMIVYNTNNYPLECQIGRLVNGQSYYVRVSSGNHRGFSEARPSSPACLAPSSWRQVDGNKRRKYDEEVYRKFTKLILLNKHVLDEHHQNAVQMLSSNLGDEPPAASSQHQSSAANSKSSLINMLLLDATMPVDRNQTYRLADGSLITTRGKQLAEEQLQKQEQAVGGTSMRKNLRNFFQSNSFKFHKLNNQNKKGLYLATVIYHSKTDKNIQIGASNCTPAGGGNSDKIIVTNDDRLPIIEIVNEPISPGALMSDFYWLLKINGTQWMDIKRLRQQLQKCHSSSTLHIRIKLLNAIEQMQLALNLEDIGRLFYKPIQAHDGSMIICTCRRVSSLKAVSNLSIKWTNQSKIIPKHLRKISDTMSGNSEAAYNSNNSNYSSNSNNRRRADSARDSTSSATILPATTITIPPASFAPAAAGSCGKQDYQPSNMQADGGLLVNYAAGSGAKLRHHSEYKLCEFCQQALQVQRRPTMASGSSSSSLTSSNDSQWSLVQQQQQQQQQATTSGAPSSANKCTCNRSVQALQSGLYLSSGGSGAAGSQRNSSVSSARSGSMIGTPPAHHASASSGHSRNSQAQHLSAAQKSSTYLMLASLTLYDLLLFTLNEIIHFDAASTIPLNRGLYLGFVQLQTTVESMRLLVPRSRPNMVPCARVRDNAHVSKEEWQLVKRFATFHQHHQQLQTSVASSNNSLTSGASASQQSVLAAPAQLQQPGSSRCSDPSIWSLERLRGRAGQMSIAAPEVAPRPRSPSSSSSASSSASSSSGFGRTRAKSVSPGLTSKQQQREQRLAATGLRFNEPEVRPCFSSSTSQLGGEQISATASAASPAAPVTSPATNLEPGPANQQAYSDSDLASARNLISSGQLVTREAGDINYDTRAGRVGGEGVACAPPGGVRDSVCSSADFRLDAHNTHKPSSPSAFQRPTSFRPFASGESFGCVPEVKSPTAASRLTVNSLTSLIQSPEETFVRLVGSAGRRLLAELKSQLPKVYDEQADEMVSILQSLNDDENNRIYHLELIELNSQVTFILLIPAAENVCPVTSHEKSNILGDNKDYMLLPLQIFETIHISTYEPDLLGKYSRLSAILETDLIVAQHDHRQAFSSNELKSTKSRVSQLQDMVSVADEFWRQLRWIVDVVSFARDKSVSIANNGIKLGSIWRHFELNSAPDLATNSNNNNSNIRASLQRDSLGLDLVGLTGTGSQQQRHARQLQVKRTSSARAKDDQSAGQPAIESVPAIHLSKFNSTGDDDDEHDHRATSGGSPEEQPAPSTPTNYQAASGGEAGATEEEEAIYAYLISLKDATRTAAQRKSSQQSTRPVLELDQAGSPKLGLASPLSNCKLTMSTPPAADLTPTRAHDQPAPNQLASGEFSFAGFPPPANDLMTPGEGDFCAQVDGRNPDSVVYVPREWKFQQVQAEPECTDRQPPGATSGRRTNQNKRHLFKTTNPFLTDSFDQQSS